MHSMGKSIAVLSVGLGLAGMLLWLGRGDARGAEPIVRRPDAPQDLEAPREPTAEELRGPPARTRPERYALPALEWHPVIWPAPRPAIDATAPRSSDDLLRDWYANGQLEYESGRVLSANGVWLREGPWRAWHENGQLHERGAYHLDEEIGPWEWWYENGQRMAVGQFDAGEREGFWRYWHEDGALMTECSYRGGKAHGPWTQYHPNGFKSAEGRFENGELVGAWTVWTEAGMLNLEGTGVYAAGEKVAE